MELKTLVVGPIETNCYLVADQGEVLIIDPGAEAERIANELEKMDPRFRGDDKSGGDDMPSGDDKGVIPAKAGIQNVIPAKAGIQASQGLRVVGIVNTHGHFDHIGANAKLTAKYQAPVMLHPADAAFLEQVPAVVRRWLPKFKDTEYKPGQPWVFLKDKAEIKVGGLTFRVIHTPGHSPGGLCLYCAAAKVLFSGDTLFADGIGRSDLPGGRGQTIRDSIFNKLFVLPDDTQVYPGHGPATTIGGERGTNSDLYGTL